MRILGRYLFREIAGHFVAITGLLFVIQGSLLFAKVLFKAASNQFTQAFVWSMLGLSALQNLKELIPIGLFLSILLALGRLYQDSEIAAMQSCGYGMRRWLTPVMAITGVVALLLTLLSLWIAPRAMTRSQEILLQATRQARFASLEPQRFRTFADNVVFYAERVDADGMLHNVFIQRSMHADKQPDSKEVNQANVAPPTDWTAESVTDRIEVTVADSAEQRGAGEALQTFVLHNGATYQGVPGKAEFRRITFSESSIPVRLPNLKAGGVRTDSKPFNEILHSNFLADRAELQARLSIPLMAIILALLAVPLSRLKPRSGRYANVGIGLLVFFVYLLAIRTGTTWVEQQTVPAALGVWWIHGLAAIFGLILLFRQDPPDWLLRHQNRMAIGTR